MRTMMLGSSALEVPVIAVGCMRIGSLEPTAAERFVRTALELGANFFDHADVYGGGRCEEVFAKAIGGRASLRAQIMLQSKCGIRRGMYDFSREHIQNAVDGTLRRLQTDYLDVLLLHRPDALVEPEEVAEAFDQLHRTGKVRHFGVSNHNPMQIELLRSVVQQPIIANQLQLSIPHASMITVGTHVNMEDTAAINRDGSILDFCRLHKITIQPWSPFQYGFFKGVFLNNDQFANLNQQIDRIAAQYEVSNTTIALAWLLRHPAKMQPVTGTTNVERLAQCAQASEVHLTREQWYEIYRSAGHTLP